MAIVASSENGDVANDSTVAILAQQALLARARGRGHSSPPSDMMDGRVGAHS